MLFIFQGTGIGSCTNSSILVKVTHGIKGLLSSILTRMIQFVLSHPALKARALALVFRYPGLEDWLYRFALAKGLVAPGMTMQICPDTSMHTPKVLLIYADLKAAIERHNKGGQ